MNKRVGGAQGGGGGQGAEHVVLSRQGVLQMNLPPAQGGSGWGQPCRGMGMCEGGAAPLERVIGGRLRLGLWSWAGGERQRP